MMFHVISGGDVESRTRSATKPDCDVCALGRASRPGVCPFNETVKPQGTVLVRQGQRPEAAWYIRSGQVLIGVSNDNGAGSCAVRGPGALLGVEALLGEPSACEAHALSEVVLCTLDAEAFRDWIGPLSSPPGVVLTLALREASRQTDERIALEGSATQRVARFLHGRHIAGAGDSALEIQKQLLARVLGMRPETLSRALAELRERGVLGRGRRVTVVDPAGLERVASGGPTET